MSRENSKGNRIFVAWPSPTRATVSNERTVSALASRVLAPSARTRRRWASPWASRIVAVRLPSASRIFELSYPFRLKDPGTLLALRDQDGGALLSVGTQDRRTPLTFGRGLLLHRGLHWPDRVHFLDLDGLDADPPTVRRLIEDIPQPRVDPFPIVEDLIELHVADDGP